jgi:hypothetical protein
VAGLAVGLAVAVLVGTPLRMTPLAISVVGYDVSAVQGTSRWPALAAAVSRGHRRHRAVRHRRPAGRGGCGRGRLAPGALGVMAWNVVLVLPALSLALGIDRAARPGGSVMSSRYAAILPAPLGACGRPAAASPARLSSPIAGGRVLLRRGAR